MIAYGGSLGGSSVRCWPILYLFAYLSPLVASAQETQVQHVSGVMPIAAPHRQLSAVRAAQKPSITQPQESGAVAHTWQLLATLPAAVIHDISFVTPAIGFVAGEHGQVWKTTDGGKTWTLVLNSDPNDYFYGVVALNLKDIVISGFYDSATTQAGVFRWSHDGGLTWTSDLTFGPTWLQRVRFANAKNGLIMNFGGGNSPTNVEFTSNGGKLLTDWKKAVSDPSGAWFDQQFSLFPNLHARASGINFCTSLTGGSQWSCTPSVDPVFDGPVFFLNETKGWVGGGEISSPVEGWVHVTTDGGKTWTPRTLDGPWPIRSLLFLNGNVGWATGGDFFSGVGGIYFSANGGKTWTVDSTTGAEMGSCTQRLISAGKRQIWCAGFMGNPSAYSSVIYGTQY